MGSYVQNRRDFLRRHVPPNAEALEFGAYAAPTLRRDEARVFYCDYKTKAQLVELAAGSVKPDDIPETDFVVKDDNYEAIPRNRFDLVIANHVLEHVVGFIAWFDLMHELLKPGGLLFVTLPDKKYNFDRYRPDTLLSHILNDHLAGHRDLGAEHVMETILYYDRQYIGQAQRPRERLDRKYVLENYRLGHHIGIHCHVFQGETFLPEILNPLIYMGYLQFTVVEFRGSRDNNGEFFVLLRKGSPAGPVDVSGFYSARASEALERLQAPQKEPTETRQVDLRPEEQLQNVQAALARQTLRVAELEMTAGHLDMTLSMIHASRSWKLARLLAAGKQLLSPRTVAKFLWTHAGCPRNSKKTVPGL